MYAGLLVMLLIGFGSSGQEVSQPHDIDESYWDTCPSLRLPPEKDRADKERCPSPSVGWSPVGEALNGAATAVRLPKL